MNELEEAANGKQTDATSAAASEPVPNPSETAPSEGQGGPQLHAANQDPATGRFLPGNAAGHKHGLISARLAPILAEARANFYLQAVADDGGEAACSRRRLSQLEYRSRLHIHIAQISDAIEHFGLFDKRGKLRAAWLQRLEGLIGRATAIDATLGLARQARRIPSLDEVMNGTDE